MHVFRPWCSFFLSFFLSYLYYVLPFIILSLSLSPSMCPSLSLSLSLNCPCFLHTLYYLLTQTISKFMGFMTGLQKHNGLLDLTFG